MVVPHQGGDKLRGPQAAVLSPPPPSAQPLELGCYSGSNSLFPTEPGFGDFAGENKQAIKPMMANISSQNNFCGVRKLGEVQG